MGFERIAFAVWSDCEASDREVGVRLGIVKSTTAYTTEADIRPLESLSVRSSSFSPKSDSSDLSLRAMEATSDDLVEIIAA